MKHISAEGNKGKHDNSLCKSKQKKKKQTTAFTFSSVTSVQIGPLHSFKFSISVTIKIKYTLLKIAEKRNTK